MDFITPIITPIVESLMVPVKKHLGFFFSSTKKVKNMSDRLLELNQTKHDMEEKKKEALINDRLIPDRVSSWFEQVETINEEAGNIPTSGNGCLNVKMRYKAGKRSFNILKKIDDLLEKQEKIKWTDKQRPLGMVINSMEPSASETVPDYDVTQDIFSSRRSIFKDVLKSLEPDSKTQMMALWGMGGVGKTTLVNEIKKVVEKRGMFQWILKVDIGKKYDPIAIQEDIAVCMGVSLTEKTREARVDRLGKSFKEMSEDGTKNILVILDDVWEAIDLKDIGLTSPFTKGFKLVVTSRNEKVCIKMDIETSSIFRLDCLEEAEANSLFWETVRISYIDGELSMIGEDILKRCGGLPIAIKTIAEALRGEEKDAWEVAEKSLRRHNFEDIEGFEGVVYKIFEISYNYLRKDDDKAIFVLCGLFPDDCDISLEELVRYGWGLQFFNKADSLVEARQQTNTSVSNLIRANLLTKSHIIGCVRMHDLARSFVLSNVSKFKQASIVNHEDKSEWPTQDTQESCERFLLTCEGMSEFPQDFYYPNLEILKLMNGDKLLKFPEYFYKPMGKLEVIAYDKMQNPLLPASLQCFTDVRTLCLHSCSLVDNDISFLGDLVNLEVLSVAHCGIQNLPSTIRKLKRLKLLDLTGCVDLSIDDGVFQNLDKLEELYMRVCDGKTIRFTNANCDELATISGKLYALEVEFFNNFLQPKNVSFKTLRRFRISMGCSLKMEAIDTKDKSFFKNTLKLGTNISDDKYSFRNTLKLVTKRSDLVESKISELFSKTEELQLSVKDMTYVEDILMHPSQHSTFSNLKVLHIFKCEDLTHLFSIHMANGLKKLEILTVSSCPVLKSLVSLCDSVNVMTLPQLVELKLYDLPNFTSIIPEDDIYATQPLFNKEVVIPKLSKLTTHNLKKLKQIWACNITSGEEDNVSMLREIEVDGCDCLVNLFPRNPVRLLSHLEKLIVKSCCSIGVLFNIDLDKIEQLGSNNSSLRSIEVVKLEELREVWRIYEENSSGHVIGGFQAVETINIQMCKKFRNVFTPTTANFDIRAIVDISISFGHGEEAQITGTSKLQEISKDDGNMSIVAFPSYHLAHSFHHIRKINFGGFDRLKVMFEMQSPIINRQLVTTQQQPLPLLPCLERLWVEHMNTLSHVWKCNNWNKFFILHKHQPQSSFQNLTYIYLLYCKSIKYLFSPLMSKLLSNLKTIYIIFCDGIEEIVSNRYDEDEVLIISTTTLFPHLDRLDLNGLRNLKHIGGGVAKGKTNVIHDQFKLSQVGVFSWSLCQYSTQIYIAGCHALSSVIPSYAAAQMHKLQNLSIHNCASMVEVFEIKEINNYGCSSNLDQGNITMHHELTNLKTLYISTCHLLEYIFTFSTLKSLKKLEELSIEKCKAMKVIVSEENGDESSKVVLPRLKSIKLDDLPNLVGFFLGVNIDFEFPSLDDVEISDCPQMMVFTSGESKAPKLECIQTWLGIHNLACGLNFHQTPPPSSDSSNLCRAIVQGSPWSFHNLVRLYCGCNDELKNIVPSKELLSLQHLEHVQVERCKNVEEVFEVTNDGSQTVVKFPKLREVELKHLEALKYIWKSNQWRILEFPNLTRLFIYKCESLEHVFTTSMVGTLMQLQELHIRRCEHVEVIVKKEEECDGRSVSEIMLPRLKSLNLEFLPSLRGFCFGKTSFTLPSLNTLVIKACPEIRIFNEGRSIAPELKLVETSVGVFHAEEDINAFIMTKKQEGNVFGELEFTSSDDELEMPFCSIM